MKIGILGGTFNPPHTGHMILAESVKDYLRLDKVIFMPCNLPPHKGRTGLLNSRHRAKMLKLALASNREFSFSGIELKRRGLSYTVDSLRVFKKKYPKDSLYLIIGSDLFKDFKAWRQPGEIKKLSRIVVAMRGSIKKKKEKGVLFVDIPFLDISSSRIRQRIRSARSVKYLLPGPVERYIQKHNLYRK